MAVGGDAPPGDVAGHVGAVPRAGVGVGQPLDGRDRPVDPSGLTFTLATMAVGQVGVGEVDAAVDDGHRHALSGDPEVGDGQSGAEPPGRGLAGQRRKLRPGLLRRVAEVPQPPVGIDASTPASRRRASSRAAGSRTPPTGMCSAVHACVPRAAEAAGQRLDAGRSSVTTTSRRRRERRTARRRPPGRQRRQMPAGGAAPARHRPRLGHHRQHGGPDQRNSQEMQDAAHGNPPKIRQDRFPHDPGK